jgi:hypothetical protein
MLLHQRFHDRCFPVDAPVLHHQDCSVQQVFDLLIVPYHLSSLLSPSDDLCRWLVGGVAGTQKCALHKAVAIELYFFC